MWAGGGVFAWRGYMAQQLLSVQKHLSLSSVCASSECYSGRCFWDLYLSLTSIAINRYSTSIKLGSSSLLLSFRTSLSRRFHVPELDRPSSFVIAVRLVVVVVVVVAAAAAAAAAVSVDQMIPARHAIDSKCIRAVCCMFSV